MNKSFFLHFNKSMRDEQDAVTSIEYALIASLIAIVIVGAVSQSGANLSALFGRVSDCVTFAVTGSGSCVKN